MGRNGAVASPVGGGGAALVTAENLGEIAGAAESDSLGDAGHGEVGFEEEESGAVESEAFDFLANGAAGGGLEAGFEESPGDHEVGDEVGDADGLGRMIDEKAEGLADEGVGGDEEVGGASGDNPDGWNEKPARGADGSAHHAVEEGGGLESAGLGVERDAGERGVGEFAEEVVVVDAQDGELGGDVEPGDPAGLEHLSAAVVVAGEDAGGPGEGGEPSGEHGLLVSPFLGALAAGYGIDERGEASGASGACEAILSARGPGAVGETDVGEVAEAPSEEMIGGDAADGEGVGGDLAEASQGSAGPKAGIGEIEDDGGQAALHDGPSDSCIFDAGDDSGASPGAHPGEDLLEVSRGEVEGPGAVDAGVSDDAAEESAPVPTGRFDEQGDTEGCGHEGA